MSTRPENPNDIIVTTMANITLARVIKELRDERDKAVERAQEYTRDQIAGANQRFFVAVTAAAADMDNSIVAMRDSDDDDDDDDDD